MIGPLLVMATHMLRLFISHSSRDIAVVEPLVDLLRSALNLNASEIRCTSLDGYRLPVGANTEEQLRREVHESAAFIGVISTASVDSMYVVFELGARWGAKKHLFPLLSPGTAPDVLADPLKSSNALRLDSAAQIHQLVSDVGNLLGITPQPAAAYQKHVDAILAIQANVQKATFEWDDVERGVRELCNQIIDHDRFRPDFLLGVPGAGVILTELALFEIGDEYLPMYMIHQKPVTSSHLFDSTNGVEFRTPNWRYWIPPEIRSKTKQKVLVLDDYAQTGASLRELKACLISEGFRGDNVKTAAFIATSNLWEAGVQPDYWWRRVDTWDVQMPWGHASKRIRMGETETK
jgi:hypoxanthine phosphoribosyltransferase